MFLPFIVSISRFADNPTNSKKESYQPVANWQRVAMDIQPASPELTAVSDGVYGNTFRAFVAISGIMIGDQITVSGYGDKYIVKGVLDWFYGPMPHLELTLFKGEQ